MNVRRSSSVADPATSRSPLDMPTLVMSNEALSAMKWLAVVLMVIDHANKYLFGGKVAWMFALGRISMPLFAIVLGFNLARPHLLRNGGYRRIALRLTIFGVLAGVPFMVLNKLIGGWWPVNMMFTLLVAVICAWLFDRDEVWASALGWFVLVWGGALVEYWWPAIGLCLCVQRYCRRPSPEWLAGVSICLAALYVVNGNFWALVALPVVLALQPFPYRLPRAQWFFYAFYPAHLFLFWLYLRATGDVLQGVAG